MEVSCCSGEAAADLVLLFFGITELEAKIDFEEKMDFCLKGGFFDDARSKSESIQELLSRNVSKAKWITDVLNCVSK